jgi:hypothetical protein
MAVLAGTGHSQNQNQPVCRLTRPNQTLQLIAFTPAAKIDPVESGDSSDSRINC